MALPRSIPVLLVVVIVGGFTLPASSQIKKPAAAARLDDDEPLLFEGNPQTIRATGLIGSGCCVSPDGKTLAACFGNSGQTGEILLWDLKTKLIRKRIEHTSDIRGVAITPDNKTTIAASFDKTIRLYDLDSGKLLGIGSGHSAGVEGVVVTKDGKTLVTAGLDRTVKVWQMPALAAGAVKPAEFKPYASLEGNVRVEAVAVSNDGRTIVSAGVDRIAHIWDMPKPAADGKLLAVKKPRHSLRGHLQQVNALAISPDDHLVATGSSDNSVRIWDLATGAEDRVISNAGSDNSYGVHALAFSTDGRTLVIGAGEAKGNPGEVRQVSVDESVGFDLRLQQPSPVRGLARTPDGKSVVCVCEERSTHLIELGEGANAQELKAVVDPGLEPQIVLAAAWSPDSKTLAYAGENKTITLRDQKTGKSRNWLAHDDVIAALAFAPDGKTLASASHDATIKLWDIGGWDARSATPPVRVLKGHTNWVLSVAFSSDGSKLVSGGYDKSVRIWNVAQQPGDVKASIVIKGREGHSAGVRSVLFMPGNREVVSAGGDRTVRFWDVGTGKELGLLRGHKGAIRALAIARAGELLATGSEDQTVKLWDLKRESNGTIVGNERAELKGHNDIVSALSFSPKDRTLAVGVWNGTIHLWDPSVGRERTVLGGNMVGQAVAALAFSPNGQKLAAGGFDQNVRIWSQSENKPTPKLAYAGHDHAVTAVALSGDGLWTATGDQYGGISIYERTGKLRFVTSPAHSGGVTGLAYSPDSKTLASVGRDHVVRVWKAVTGEALSQFQTAGENNCVAYSPDGQYLASAGTDKLVCVWDAKTGAEVKKLAGHAGEVRALAFSPDGSLLASAGADRTFRLWDAKSVGFWSRKKTWQVKHQSPTNPNNGEYYALAFSPDGSTLALAHNQDQVISPDGQLEQQQFRHILFIDTATGLAKLELQNQFNFNEWITGVGFLADGQTIVAVARDSYLRFMSMSDGRVLRQIRAHQAAINALAIDPLTDQIATGGDDRVAALWNGLMNEAGPRASLTAQTKQVWFAEVSKDGSMIATGGDDKVVRVRKGIAGSQPFTFEQPFKACFSLATSPDGSMIASGHGDGSIILWDSASGKRIKKLEGHSETVWSLAFLADGKRLVSSSGSWDRRENEPGEVKLWDVEKASVIREYPGHAGAVYAAMLSPDGKTLATGSQDRTIRLWDLETGKLRHTLKGHGGGVRTIAFLDQGKSIVSGSHEEADFIFWSVESGKETSRKSVSGRINRLRASPDGKSLAIVVSIQNAVMPDSDDGSVPLPQPYVRMQAQPETGMLQIWDLATQSFKNNSSNGKRMLDCAFSPDGSAIATVGGIYAEVGEICLWQASDGQRLGELHGHKRWLEAVAFTKDGRLISGGGINRRAQTGQPVLPVPVAAPPVAAPRLSQMEPGEMRIWDVRGIQPTLELKAHTNPVTCGDFSPDSKMLATGARGGSVFVFDLPSARKGGPVNKINLKQESPLHSLRFSPNGQILAAGDESGKVKIWDPKTGSLLQVIEAHGGSVHHLAFSNDGRTLATCAGDLRTENKGEVKLWDVTTGKPIGELEKLSKPVWSVVFAPKAGLLATACGDGNIRIYDANSLKLLHQIQTSSGVRSIAFSPDGMLLAAGHNTDNDPMVRLWETGTWREWATLAGHQGAVHSVRFAPDGKTIVSSSKDGTAKIWNVPPRKTMTAMK